MQTINRTYLLWLIIAGIIEGTSTLFLFFVAMPLKYGFGMPEHVSVAGRVHGVLFLALVMMFWIGKTVVPLSSKLMWWGMIGAIVPFGPFIVDVPLYRMLKDNQE